MGTLDDDDFCEVTGLRRTEASDQQRQRLLEIYADDARKRRRQLELEGIRFGVTSDDESSYQTAVERVEHEHGTAIEVAESEAARGDGWWLIPVGWIGCSGQVVYDSGAVVALGSALVPFDWMWALLRGLPADFSLFEVVITAVHDAKRAGRLMGRALPGGTGSRLIRLAQDGPIRFESNWMLLKDLKRAEEQELFDFHLET